MYHADVRIDPRQQVRELLEQMRGAITNRKRHDQLSDAMEVLVMSYLEPAIEDEIPGVRLTEKESRIVARLKKGDGKLVTKSQIMDAMYFDARDDEPEMKIIDILIFRIRQKIKASNRFRIDNDHGRGFRWMDLAA